MSSNEAASNRLWFDSEAGKLPQVRFVDRRSAPLPEESGPAFERRPGRRNRRAGTEVGTRDVENLPVRQVVGHENALERVFDHVGQTSQHGGSDLKGCRI